MWKIVSSFFSFAGYKKTPQTSKNCWKLAEVLVRKSQNITLLNQDHFYYFFSICTEFADFSDTFRVQWNNLDGAVRDNS